MVGVVPIHALGDFSEAFSMRDCESGVMSRAAIAARPFLISCSAEFILFHYPPSLTTLMSLVSVNCVMDAPFRAQCVVKCVLGRKNATLWLWSLFFMYDM